MYGFFRFADMFSVNYLIGRDIAIRTLLVCGCSCGLAGAHNKARRGPQYYCGPRFYISFEKIKSIAAEKLRIVMVTMHLAHRVVRPKP